MTSLDEWLELVRSQNMPIFDHTVQRVIAVAGNDLAPMSELAGVILQDASMTARVLKLANSILYNPSVTGISTVTRAVIVLGLNAVRNICLTLTLIDTLVKGDARDRLGRELGRTMHAAVQARALAAAQGDKSPEEVFIATLLYRIGELAFWCFGGEQADKVEQLMRQGDLTPEQAQERVLGFRLSQLSRQLVREWHLTELLHEAINHPAHRDQRIDSIMLGQQIARCAEQHGWHSGEMDQVVKKVAVLSALPEDQARALLLQKARAAASVVTDYGASFAAPYIPLPGRAHDDSVEPAANDTPAPSTACAAQEQRPQRDTKLQIKILRELTSMLDGSGCNFNVIMELVLEGIFRGVGVDRVVFALTTPDKGALKAKFALGADWVGSSEGFNFTRPHRGQDILFQTMDHKRPSLVVPGLREDVDRLIPEQLTQLTGPTAFMVAPIIIDNQSIGLFYADRGPSHRPLDADSFDDFKHFVHQASMGLTMASARR
ncbi:histidine kinase [Thiocystis violacea]|nr:HDOD domain-containing protein [Thiocystis violacea]MBK1722796.1 histidine kinase [Thiocystis violacea]